MTSGLRGAERRTCSPTCTDPVKIDPDRDEAEQFDGARPRPGRPRRCSRSSRSRASPPNWHGVMRVVRSAEMRRRRAAKTHSSGDCGRVGVDVDQALGRLELRIAQPQRHQVGDDALAVGGRQPFVRDLADLRRVEADPDLPRLRLRRPEPQELFEIARPVHLLPRDRAVDDDLVPDDVLQDAVVGGRRAPHVVLGLQAVDRDDDRELRDRRPLLRNLADGARDELEWMPRAERSGRSAFSSL